MINSGTQSEASLDKDDRDNLGSGPPPSRATVLQAFSVEEVIEKVGIAVGSFGEDVSTSPGPVLSPHITDACKSQTRESKSGWEGDPKKGIAADGSQTPFLSAGP